MTDSKITGRSPNGGKAQKRSVSPPRKRCLILSSNVSVGRQIASLLEEKYEWRIYVVHSGTQAYARLSKDSIDVVIANISARALGGLAFLEHCHRNYPSILTYGIAAKNDGYREKLARAIGGCRDFFYLMDKSPMIDSGRGMAAGVISK